MGADFEVLAREATAAYQSVSRGPLRDALVGLYRNLISGGLTAPMRSFYLTFIEKAGRPLDVHLCTDQGVSVLRVSMGELALLHFKDEITPLPCLSADLDEFLRARRERELSKARALLPPWSLPRILSVRGTPGGP